MFVTCTNWKECKEKMLRFTKKYKNNSIKAKILIYIYLLN